MSRNIIQSAGGIVYKLDSTGEPKYLLIKRYALSKKIEWVCPKWKLEKGETAKEAALREVVEEAWLPKKNIRIFHKLWVTKLRNTRNVKGMMNKDTTYFLMEYKGDTTDVDLEDSGGFIGIYKWATFNEVLGLIYYQDIRELIRKAHQDVIKNLWIRPSKAT